MSEPTLFPDDPLYARFVEFDRENPHIWSHFARFAAMAVAAGRVRYSADALIHRVRWHLDVETTTAAESFKICNNHVAFYARRWNETHPEAAIFELRERRSLR